MVEFLMGAYLLGMSTYIIISIVRCVLDDLYEAEVRDGMEF